MTDKSHVSMEQHICIVCGKPFDTGSILLHKRLRQVLERHTVTGMGMCPEHAALRDQGYIALIECDPSKSKIAGDTVKNHNDAYRTGVIVHVKAEAWRKLFDIPVPDKMMAFVEPAAVALITELSEQGKDK